MSDILTTWLLTIALVVFPIVLGVGFAIEVYAQGLSMFYVLGAGACGTFLGFLFGAVFICALSDI